MSATEETRWKRLASRSALAIAPAVLLGVYAWYPMLAFLPWIALVPWVLLYADDDTPRPSFGYYAFGAYLAWILQYTQAWKFGWYAPLIMGLICIVWWLPFAPLLAWLHRNVRVPRALAVALAWTSVEWLRTSFTVSHFDLYGLGYSQARFPILVQFADVTGVYGVSFLVAAVNGWLADWILTARETGAWAALRRPQIARGLAVVLAALAAVSAYGAWRLGSAHHEAGPRLALVQPNLPHGQDNLIEVHLAQLAMTAREVPAGEVDLIVWPENAIMDDIFRDGVYLEDLAALGRQKDAWFLVGALGYRDDLPGRTTNGAWLVDPQGTVRGSYHKQVLFPWSEYIPGDEFLGRWLPGVQRFHRWITRLGWGFQPTGTPGHETRILELPLGDRTVRFAPLICVENSYPPVPAAAGRKGADFFLNITSEGLVGGPVQEQLLRIAMFRAIENRMAYVRVGNNGISGVMDDTGRATAILRGAGGATINTPGTLVAEVPLSGSPGGTLYARSRDLFVRLVVAVTMLCAVVSWLPRRRTVAAAVAAAGLAFLLTGCMSPPSLDGRPDAVGGNLERGRAGLASGRIPEAIDSLAAACATEDGCRRAIPLLVQAYGRSKVDDVAVATFAEIAERYPSLRADARVASALFLERIHDLPAAREAYLDSIAVRPSAAAYERLARLEVRTKNFDDAIAALRAGLAIQPDAPRLRYLLGRQLTLRGRLDEAEIVIRRLLDEQPDHAAAWTVLGWLRIARGDRPGAVAALHRALRADPDSSEARYLIAKLAARSGDWDTVDRMTRELGATGASVPVR